MRAALRSLQDAASRIRYREVLNALTDGAHALSGCRVQSAEYVAAVKTRLRDFSSFSPFAFLLPHAEANPVIGAELFIRLRPLPIYLLQLSSAMMSIGVMWHTPLAFWNHDIFHALSQLFRDVHWMMQDVDQGGLAWRPTPQLAMIATQGAFRLSVESAYDEQVRFISSMLNPSSSQLNATRLEDYLLILDERFSSFQDYLSTERGRQHLLSNPQNPRSLFAALHEGGAGLYNTPDNPPYR